MMVLLSYVQWKVFILDERSKRLVDCVIPREDDILQENVTSV